MAKSQLPKMLKPGEVADALSVSRSVVYGLIEKGKIPCHRIGLGRGTIRISEHDVSEFLRSTRVDARQASISEKVRPKRRRLRHLKG